MTKHNILVAIDIHNNPQVLKVILDSIPYLKNEWQASNNANPRNKHWQELPNRTARYFAFQLNDRNFYWLMKDRDVNSDGYSINSVKNVSEASELMDYIYDLDSSETIHNSADGKWKFSKD